jgi:hypothetical protein
VSGFLGGILQGSLRVDVWIRLTIALTFFLSHHRILFFAFSPFPLFLFQGGFFNAISGAGGVKIQIRSTPTPEQRQSPHAIAKIDHYPNW